MVRSLQTGDRALAHDRGGVGLRWRPRPGRAWSWARMLRWKAARRLWRRWLRERRRRMRQRRRRRRTTGAQRSALARRASPSTRGGRLHAGSSSPPTSWASCAEPSTASAPCPRATRRPLPLRPSRAALRDGSGATCAAARRRRGGSQAVVRWRTCAESCPWLAIGQSCCRRCGSRSA